MYVSILDRSNVASDILWISAYSLNWYRFIGRILGKAMYEGILIDVAFAGFFLSKVRWHYFYLHIWGLMDTSSGLESKAFWTTSRLLTQNFIMA